MTMRAFPLPFVVLLTLGGVVPGLGGACSPPEEPAAATSPAGPPQAAPRGVRVTRVAERELEEALEVTGEVLARAVVDVAPLGSGRLEGLRVDEGDRVQAGQLIATLDDDTESARRRELEATLASAQARASTARAAVREHERELERRRTLVARGALGTAEVERWEDQLPRLENEVAVLEAAVREIRSTQRTAELNERRRAIRAPIGGLVVTRHVIDGAMVTPQTPVVTIVDEESIEWLVRIHEERLAQITFGSRARARLDARPDEVLAGVVTRVGAVVDREARTVELGVRLDAGETRLRHGMFARGEVVISRAERLPSLPVEAVQFSEREGATVLLVRDGVVEAVPIEVIFRTRRHVALRGLEVGDPVVVNAPNGLRPGDRVVIVGDPGEGREAG